MHHYSITVNLMKSKLGLTSRIVLILFLSLIFADSEAYSQCSTQPPSAPGSLILTTVTTSQSTPTPNPTASASGLVAHWTFNEVTGTTACDSSGNGNTGTLINGPLRAAGKVKGALYFDGIDDHVTVANSNSLDVSSSFTLSAWVNPASSFTDFRSILVKNYKYYLYASVAGYCGIGNPIAGFHEQTTHTVCQPSPLPANTWTHLAATYTGSTLTLYRNGTAVATSNITKALSSTTGTLQIGASQFGENFKGLIDEVRVHNRALTNTEIQALFQQEAAVRESGLVAHWKFDEGNGTTASDSSGSGNAGILINGPLWTDGRAGKGLYFDGIDDHVMVADSNSLDVSSSFTLSAWVNPAFSFTDFRSILVKNYKYYLYASVAGYCGSGTPLAGFNEQTSNNVCQPTSVPANTWTHLAATYTGSILTLYRNGVAVATSNITKTLSSTTGTLQIGASQFGENFKGLIDEIRVHNRALTNTEIQALFQQESGGTSTSLVTGVSAPSTSSQFSFSLSNSGDKSVAPGSSVTNSIAANLVSASSQAISFSVSGLPSGTTASFSSASCTPACSSTLTVNTTGSTPAGSSTITVAATGGGTTKTTTFTLTVGLPTVATPTISPTGGSFTGSVSVSMQSGTSGASIYYTTNGSTPTQSSTLYTGAMTLASSATVKAKAFKSGSNPSGEASASFTVSQVQLAGAAKGITRYADGQLSSNCTNGNYSIALRNCTGSDGNAYRSLQDASNASAPGDTVLIRRFSGIYTGTGLYGGIDVKSGPSFGTDCSNCTVIQGYQSEFPSVAFIGGSETASRQFVYVKNLVIDGSPIKGNGITGITHSRFENVELKNAYAHGIIGVSDLQLINMNVHDNGFRADQLNDCGAVCHGFYGGSGANFLFDGGEWHHNRSYGIQCYSNCQNSIIRNIRVHHNGGAGMIVTGSNNTVYNIIVDNNGWRSAGHGLHINTSGMTVYNVTAYNNNGTGICVDASNATVRNTISVQNAGGNLVANNCNGSDFSSTFTQTNNITSVSAASLFVDAANGNSRLKPTSRIKGVGADLSTRK